MYHIFQHNTIDDIVRLHKLLLKNQCFFMNKHTFSLFFRTNFSQVVFSQYSLKKDFINGFEILILMTLNSFLSKKVKLQILFKIFDFKDWNSLTYDVVRIAYYSFI